MNELNAFLGRLSFLQAWDVLLVQEFSRAAFIPEVSSQGHRVYAGCLHEGQFRLAIVVNKDFAGVARNFESHGRAVSLDIDWEDFRFRCISAHLHPGAVKALYSTSLDDVRFFVNSDRLLLIGSDTQDALGPRQLDDPLE